MSEINQLRVQLDRIRRRGWVVVLLVLVVVIVGTTSVLVKGTSYSSKATLGLSTSTRAPEQDAIQAQGYVNFFNEPVYQAVLRKRADVPGNVTFEAESVVSSPLIYITATSPDQAAVRTAAAAMATALQDTVNDSILENKQQAIAALRKPYTGTGDRTGMPEQAIIDMQDRIAAINADTTNQLQAVELTSGVTVQPPNVLQGVGLSLFAGLVLGIAAALAMGALSRRVDSADELRLRSGLRSLGTIPRAEDPERRERYGQIVNALIHRTGAGPKGMVIMVTAPHDRASIASVAAGLAERRAHQGGRVLLVQFDLRESGSAAGWSDFVRGPHSLDLSQLVRRNSAQPNLWELGAGTAPSTAGGLDATAITEALIELRAQLDCVVLAGPQVIDCADAQLSAAAADSTVLVVEQARTRTTDVAESLRLLEQVSASVGGAVCLARGAETPALDWSTADAGAAELAQPLKQADQVRKSKAVAAPAPSGPARRQHVDAGRGSAS